jgi:hypothetical protein
MQIDQDRWLALLSAYADAREDGPDFSAVQSALALLARARVDLDNHRSRGALGRADEHHTIEAINAAFTRDLAELERRVATADREAKRLEARQRECAARRTALRRTIDGIREWAQAQQPPVVLPGDELELPPVASVQGPSPQARDFLAGEPLPQSAWRGGAP